MEKAIICARVSSKDQELEGYSIPAQLKLLHEYAQKKGYIIAKEFSTAETAKKAGRKQFNEMIRFLEENRIKHVLVEKTDRLLRNMTDYARIDQLISECEVAIHLVKEGVVLTKDSHSTEKLIFGIKALMAKSHLDNLSEETIKGMKEKADQRVYPSKAPYGYLNAEEGDKRVIKTDPTSALYVKRMFELYSTGQHSLKSLREKMVSEGMVYNRGKKLYKRTIEVILKNEFYTGVFYWKSRKYESAQHEPLISKELFMAVQARLINPNKYKSRKDIFAYTNLITCGHCGCAVTAEIKKAKYIYYHCSGYRGNCKQPYLKEEVIDERIASLLEHIEVPEHVEKMILEGMKQSLQDKIEYHNTNVQQIERQMKVLQNRIDQAYMDKLDGEISEDYWKTQNRKWLAQKEELSMKLVGYQKADTAYIEQASFILELAKKSSRLFKRANREQKRRFMDLLFSNCILKDGNLDLQLKTPFDTILKSSKIKDWRPLLDYFRTFSFSTQGDLAIAAKYLSFEIA